MRRRTRWWEPWLWGAISAWRLTLLAAASVVVIFLLTHFYIVPATRQALGGTPEERRFIRVLSLLLMSIMLTLLAIGVVWAARRRR